MNEVRVIQTCDKGEPFALVDMGDHRVTVSGPACEELANRIAAMPPADLVAALVEEVRGLPRPGRSLLTHNERELIEFCYRLAEALRPNPALASPPSQPAP